MGVVPGAILVRSSPRRGVQAGKGTGSPHSVASHDAMGPVPVEALSARLDTAAHLSTQICPYSN